jgi:hypothetical protein
MPKASKEKIEATVFKKMYEKKHKAEEPDDPELTLKPNMSKTIANTKTRVYYHTGTYGKWEWKKIDPNKPAVQSEKECWSCCMNREKDSEGCVFKIKDMKKWILSSHA